MKRFRTLALPVAVAALLVGAPTVAAKPCHDQNTVPPGNSEVDQYSETVPGECGNENPPAPDSEGNGSLDSIPPGAQAQFESLGRDGRAAALLAAAGAPGSGVGAPGGGSGSENEAEGGTDGSPGLPGDSPLAAPGILDSGDDDGSVVDSVFDALSGDSGLGIVLPLTLALIAALALVVALRNRRSGA